MAITGLQCYQGKLWSVQVTCEPAEISAVSALSVLPLCPLSQWYQVDGVACRLLCAVASLWAMMSLPVCLYFASSLLRWRRMKEWGGGVGLCPSSCLIYLRGLYASLRKQMASCLPSENIISTAASWRPRVHHWVYFI